MNRIKTSYKILFLFLIIFNFSDVKSQVKTENLKKHIYFLASDSLKGRLTGTIENKISSDYIENEFKKYGLIPKGTLGYRQSFKFNKKIKKENHEFLAENIIGFINNNSPKTIIIGAHYDHLGLGEFTTRDTINIGKIHNGADDNASGVAGLLELARHFSENKITEKVNFMFIAFGAEEFGLIGSDYFVNHPTINLKSIHWMLNFDMIGRYSNKNRLAIIGAGTALEFDEILKDLKSNINYTTSRDGSGGSDQTSFYKKNIPVLFFHTGDHEDYHKSTDDADKINFEALNSIIILAIDIINKSQEIELLNFSKTH